MVCVSCVGLLSKYSVCSAPSDDDREHCSVQHHGKPHPAKDLGRSVKFRVVGREGEGFGVALKFSVSRLRYQKLPVVIRYG